MIRLFIKLGAIILPVAVLVIYFNYFVDPANTFSAKKYLSGIADILSKGHNVDKISNYDERLLQEQMVIRINSAPDVVVLGSSRIMEIGSDFFPAKRVLNLGVSHANIHDLIAIAGLLDSLGKLPREVLINVDPGLICKKATTEWQSLLPYYNNFLNKLPNSQRTQQFFPYENRFKKIYSLVSFEYFKESVLFLAKRKSKQFTDVGKQVPANYGRYSDGSICYPSDYIHPDTFIVRKVAQGTATGEGLSPSEPENILLLNKLLDFFKGHKIKTEFIMLPFHPAYYLTINSRQQNIFNDYEIFFRKLATERNIPIRGSFNASSVGIENAQFYDMYHCSKEAVKTTFNKVI